MKTTSELLHIVGHHPRPVNRKLTLPYGPRPLSGRSLPDVTMCSVCAAPTHVHPMCSPCDKRSKSCYRDRLADVVVPLSYAGKQIRSCEQHYSDIYQYKEGSSPALYRLAALLYLFYRHHAACLVRHVGAPVRHVTAVPSGRGRTGHPLPELAGSLKPSLFVPAQYVGLPRTGRANEMDPDDFAFDAPLSGHVMIVEDTWVTGANAQALAVKARECGADQVSIVVLARMLNPGFGLNPVLIKSEPFNRKWDLQPCPVTGDNCQPPTA